MAALRQQSNKLQQESQQMRLQVGRIHALLDARFHRRCRHKQCLSCVFLGRFFIVPLLLLFCARVGDWLR
jgi:hypothetical protein